MEVHDTLVNNFLIKFQKELLHRADTIGLMSHASTNGMLKEFLVKSVLESILPADCGIFSGIVFDGKGNQSKQIDIIIYDNRVPKFELAKGVGFYPIEGVMASIEVNSQLQKDDIYSALDNSLSLLKLEPILCGNVKIDKGDDWVRPSNDLESRKAAFQYRPATYIFSFDSVTTDTAMKHVKNWFTKNENPTQTSIALVPRAMVGKDWIGMLDDSFITIPEKILKKSTTNNGMVFLKSENYFSYFISHLLHKISIRIKANQGVTDCYYSINKLLPLERILGDEEGEQKFLSL